MRLSNTDARVVRTVLRHNGIPDAEHQAVIDGQIVTTMTTDGHLRPNITAMRIYRQIYGSLTPREMERAQVRIRREA